MKNMSFKRWVSTSFLMSNSDQQSDFKRRYERDMVVRTRWALLLAVLVMVIYGGLDFVMIPPSIRSTVSTIRFGMIIPVLIAAWLTTYQKIMWPWMQYVAVVTAIITGLGVILITITAQQNGANIAYEGLMLTIFYFYYIGGLRSNFAGVAGCSLSVLYIYAEYSIGLANSELMDRALFLATTNMIGIAGCIIMERLALRKYAVEQKLEEMASLDFLTSLPNRRALGIHLETLWRQAYRENMPLSLAMIDVDHFKTYNDHYGHGAGDDALIKVASTLSLHVRRPLDIVARYGGEEFVAAWYGVSKESTEVIISRVVTDIKTLGIAHTRSDTSSVLTISMGVIHIPARSELTLAAALQTADKLLYEAKHSGRNRYVID